MTPSSPSKLLIYRGIVTPRRLRAARWQRAHGAIPSHGDVTRLRRNPLPGSIEQTEIDAVGEGDAHRKCRSCDLCGDPDRCWNSWPGPWRFRSDLATGTQVDARTRSFGLSLRRRLAGLWHRPALGTHCRPGRTTAAGLPSRMDVALQSPGHLPPSHCGSGLPKL